MAIEEVQEIYINNIIPSGSGFALNACRDAGLHPRHRHQIL
jgi:hypothetical protein